MNKYDRVYLQQLAPLISVHLDEPGSVPEQEISKNLNKHNLAGTIWDNCIIKDRISSAKFMIEYTGDIDFKLTSIHDNYKHEKYPETHSILSPFNPGSDIFPNGLISEKWFTKYIEDLPFAIISAFNLPQRTDDSENTRLDLLAQRLLQLKTQSTKYGIHFVAVIIGDGPHEEDRLTYLRNITGLSKISGLFYLQNGAHIERDAAVLVSTILSGLKSIAVDFYSSIEQKIRLRYKKYYSYPVKTPGTNVVLKPSFLEARNCIKLGILGQFSRPQNMEHCLKSLLTAYDQLIELLNENFRGELLPHDLTLYQHFRNLVDIMAFHIVRGYMAMEDPLSALRKHKAHVDNIINVTGNDSNWISIQYELLAELLELIPNSIKSRVKNSRKLQKKFGGPLSIYYGGIQFHDAGKPEFDVTTHSGFLYLKAANVGSIKEGYSYMDNKAEPRISLLEKAVKAFQIGDIEDETLPSIFQYLNWQIGDLYYEEGNLEKALHYYTKSFETVAVTLKPLGLLKLLQCYHQLSDSTNLAKTLLLLSEFDLSKLLIPNLKIESEILNQFKSNQNIFESYSLVINKNSKSSKIDVFDNCLFQFEIKCQLNFETLAKFLNISQDEITIDITSIEIKFNGLGFTNILLEKGMDSNIKSSKALQHVDIENGKGSIALSFNCKNSHKVLQFEMEAIKVGQSQIKSVVINSEILAPSVKIYNVSSKLCDYKHHSNFYQEKSVESECLNDYYQQSIRILEPSSIINVHPKIPKLKLNLQNKESNIILGEKMKLDFSFDLTKGKGIEYDKLFIIAIVRLNGAHVSIQSNWNEYKDDQPLSLSAIKENPNHSFYIQIEKSPTSKQNIDGKLSVVFQMLREEEDHNTTCSNLSPTSYELQKYEFDVVTDPFICEYSVLPRYRVNNQHNDMPNPFVLQKDIPIKMPIAVRLWKGIAKIQTDIKIDSTEFFLKTLNPDVEVNIVEKNGLEFYFTTASKNGYILRNVTVNVRLNIKWKRENSDILNEHQIKDWDVTLPYSEPRLLLNVHEDKARETLENERLIRLHYVIENPTTRVFTFAATLNNIGKKWKIKPHAIPSTPFPVLPYMRHIIDIVATHYGDGELELPSMNLTDINFNVNLPTLPVCDEVISKGGILFYDINEKN